MVSPSKNQVAPEAIGYDAFVFARKDRRGVADGVGSELRLGVWAKKKKFMGPSIIKNWYATLKRNKYTYTYILYIYIMQYTYNINRF